MGQGFRMAAVGLSPSLCLEEGGKGEVIRAWEGESYRAGHCERIRVIF